MTSTALALDQHSAVCSTLDRSGPILAEVVRRCRPDVRPVKMRWTSAELAAHLVSSLAEAEKAARGEPSAYDGVGPNAAVDDQLVAATPEREPEALAALLAERTARFTDTLRRQDPTSPVAMPRGTVAVLGGLLALDQHLHGGQIAEASGGHWSGAAADLREPLATVLGYAFDPEAARGFRGSYELRLRGVEPVRYAIADGELVMDYAGPVDCKVTADPTTFLRLGIGVVSQARAVLTGKLRSGGRKPWLSFAANRLFPPIPHGGVDR